MPGPTARAAAIPPARLRPKISRSPLLEPTWWLAAGSMLLILLNAQLSSYAVGGYLAIWVGYAFLQPMRSIDQLLRIGMPWVLPILAVASVLWSEDRGVTMRVGLELLASTGAAIIMARAVSVRNFVSAFAAATVLACVFSYISGRSEMATGTGEALTGVFSSKNQLAYTAGLGVLGSLGVLFNKEQPMVFRLGAVFGLMLCPLLVYRAHSAGGTAALAGAIGVVAACAFARSVPDRWRATVTAAGVIVAIAVAAVGVDYLSQQSAGLLSLAGKDSTLTGRTVLWSHADIAIAAHPALGVGYQAFWVLDSPAANALWTLSHQKPGPGFHFHNLSYETTVEFGYIGLALFGGFLLMTLANSVIWQLRFPDTQSSFFLSICAFHLLRCYLEVDFLFPFCIGTVVLPVVYVATLGGRRGCLETRYVVPRAGAAGGRGLRTMPLGSAAAP